MTVSQAQSALNKLGYRDYEGKLLTVDGQWGARSASALKKFQAAAGITVDGLFGPQSATALNNALNNSKTSPVTTKPVSKPVVATGSGSTSASSNIIESTAKTLSSSTLGNMNMKLIYVASAIIVLAMAYPAIKKMKKKRA
jgi:peptidoglycan hydrolase-like protein with peptidoglycan-binding domain